MGVTIVLLVIAVAFMVVITLAMVYGQSSSKARHLCMDDEQRERVRNIMADGIDAALKEHAKHLFDIWVKDSADQPGRAITGMHNGVDAYVRARASVLKWSPPKCEGAVR